MQVKSVLPDVIKLECSGPIGTRLISTLLDALTSTPLRISPPHPWGDLQPTSKPGVSICTNNQNLESPEFTIPAVRRDNLLPTAANPKAERSPENRVWTDTSSDSSSIASAANTRENQRTPDCDKSEGAELQLTEEGHSEAAGSAKSCSSNSVVSETTRPVAPPAEAIDDRTGNGDGPVCSRARSTGGDSLESASVAAASEVEYSESYHEEQVPGGLQDTSCSSSLDSTISSTEEKPECETKQAMVSESFNDFENEVLQGSTIENHSGPEPSADNQPQQTEHDAAELCCEPREEMPKHEGCEEAEEKCSTSSMSEVQQTGSMETEREHDNQPLWKTASKLDAAAVVDYEKEQIGSASSQSSDVGQVDQSQAEVQLSSRENTPPLQACPVVDEGISDGTESIEEDIQCTSDISRSSEYDMEAYQWEAMNEDKTNELVSPISRGEANNSEDSECLPTDAPAAQEDSHNSENNHWEQTYVLASTTNDEITTNHQFSDHNKTSSSSSSSITAKSDRHVSSANWFMDELESAQAKDVADPLKASQAASQNAEVNKTQSIHEQSKAHLDIDMDFDDYLKLASHGADEDQIHDLETRGEVQLDLNVDSLDNGVDGCEVQKLSAHETSDSERSLKNTSPEIDAGTCFDEGQKSLDLLPADDNAENLSGSRVSSLSSLGSLDSLDSLLQYSRSDTFTDREPYVESSENQSSLRERFQEQGGNRNTIRAVVQLPKHRMINASLINVLR